MLLIRTLQRELLYFLNAVDRGGAVHQGRQLLAHLNKRPLHLPDELENCCESTISHHSPGDAVNSPKERNGVANGEGERYQSARNYTKLGPTHIFLIIVHLQFLQVLAARLCVFKYLKQHDVLDRFLNVCLDFGVALADVER